MANQGHIIIGDGRSTYDKAVDEAARLYIKSMDSATPLPEFDRETGLYDIPDEKPPVKLNLEETLQVIKSMDLCGVKTRVTYIEQTGALTVEMRNSINPKVGIGKFNKGSLLYENSLRASLRSMASTIR